MELKRVCLLRARNVCDNFCLVQTVTIAVTGEVEISYMAMPDIT
jgi:hypothetical protein